MTHTPASDATAGTLAIGELAADSTLTGVEFLAEYRALRIEHELGAQEHSPRAVQEVVTVLARYPHASYADVLSLLGGQHDVTQRAHRKVLEALGQNPRPSNRAGNGDDVARFRTWMLAICGSLPHTALDPDIGSAYAMPEGRHCRRVMALEDLPLRLAAGLDLLLVYANRHAGPVRDVVVWELLDDLRRSDSKSNEGRERGAAAAWPRKAATFALINSWFEQKPTPARLRNWKVLSAAGRRIAEYLTLNPDVEARMTLQPAQVALVRTRSVRTAARAEKINARRHRHRNADPIADQSIEFLQLAKARAMQFRDIRDAYDACRINMIDPYGEPVDFALTMDPWLDERGDCPPITIDFRIWPAETLHRVLYSARAGMRRMRYAAENRTHFLQLVGPRAPALPKDLPPILRAYCVGYFAPIAARTAQCQAEFLALVADLERPPAHTALRLFRYTSQRDRRWSDQALRQGIILIPVEQAHYGLAVAHSHFRGGIVTGARAMELAQQSASDRSFGSLDGQDYFYAVTKRSGRPAPAVEEERKRFFFDASTSEAILEVINAATRNGWGFNPIPPASKLKDRCPADAYIYRMGGTVIPSATINASLRALMMGRWLECHDLRHVHGKNGVDLAPRSAVQASLHHESAATTAIYTSPTPRQQAELARAIGERIRGHDGGRNAKAK